MPFTYQARKEHFSSEMVTRKMTEFQVWTMRYLAQRPGREADTWQLIRAFTAQHPERTMPRLATSHRRALNKIPNELLGGDWQKDTYILTDAGLKMVQDNSP